MYNPDGPRGFTVKAPEQTEHLTEEFANGAMTPTQYARRRLEIVGEDTIYNRLPRFASRIITLAVVALTAMAALAATMALS